MLITMSSFVGELITSCVKRREAYLSSLLKKILELCVCSLRLSK